MKRKLATKTVNYETLRKALIKCSGYEGEKMATILDKVLNVNGKWIWPNANTEFTKVKDGYFKVQGNFAEDYLR